jgi:Ala-tRNA(Pro) deacylase
MPVQKLKAFLDTNNIEYETISHTKAFTASRTAASAHIPGKELAKTVMVIVDGKMSMAVLPSSCRVNFDLLKEAINALKIELASEMEFKYAFPNCEVGAMPPFGNLWDMPVYVAERLTEDEEIAFNAGTHTELIKMSYQDFERLVKPTIIRFSTVDAGVH